MINKENRKFIEFLGTIGFNDELYDDYNYGKLLRLRKNIGDSSTKLVVYFWPMIAFTIESPGGHSYIELTMEQFIDHLPKESQMECYYNLDILLDIE